MSSSKTPSPVYYSLSELGIKESKLSNAALSFCKELGRAGYSTQLVGGCIRDLILGRSPKDFDIATIASPSQIQRVFPRSRVIGQRFKIIHARVKGELLEITTYRRAVQDHDKNNHTGQVLNDNAFGSIVEDASRRDFTINALYYDPSTKKVVDYFQGIDDLARRQLRLIGDPQVRFAEDPGRILRAVRFQAKYGFDVTEKLINAIYQQKHNLDNIPPARRFDELLKLFYSGQAAQVWTLLIEYDLLPYLFAYASNEATEQGRLSKVLTQKALHSTDARVKADKPVISAFMFSGILWPFYQQRFQQLLKKRRSPQDAMIQASEEVIARQLIKTGMLRRVTNTIRDIWWMQYRLETSANSKAFKVLEHQRFRAGYDFLLLRAQSGDANEQIAQFWTDLQEQEADDRVGFIDKNMKKPNDSKAKTQAFRKRRRGGK